MLLLDGKDVDGTPVTRTSQPLALHVEADGVDVRLLGSSTQLLQWLSGVC